MKLNCKNCGKEIERYPAQIERSKTGNVYCSRSCSNSTNNTLFKTGENHPNYTNGRSSYRNRKLKESEKKCENCGIDNTCVLEVHHKDGDRSNNSIENLSLLCANCHLIEHCNKNIEVG
jgi:HNH endonuclease